MEKALIIDIQNTNEKGFPDLNNKFYLQRFSELNVPVNINLTPYQRDQWFNLEDDIGNVLAIRGSGLFLEGLLHICMLKNHVIRDPHHQDVCTSFFSRKTSYEETLERIGKGIEFLEKIFGKNSVDGYVPPQHLYNDGITKAVCEFGLEYLITNAMFSNMYPYEENGITIVPSGSVKHNRANNPVVHFYYDRIINDEELFDSFLQNTKPLSEIPVRQKTLYHSLNQPAIKAAKHFRDAKRLFKWLTNKYSRGKPDAETIREIRQAQYDRYRGELFK